jgi:hypothetical protein
MQVSETGGPQQPDAPRYVIRFKQSFDSALEAGRFFQARVYRLVYIGFGAGLALGGVMFLFNPTAGIFIVAFSGLFLIVTRLDLLDRLIGRRRARSVLDQPIQLSLGEQGILWEGPLATSNIPWTSLTEVRSNERTVLFVRDRLLVAYAPAASFATAEEQAEVVAFSRERIAAVGGAAR